MNTNPIDPQEEAMRLAEQAARVGVPGMAKPKSQDKPLTADERESIRKSVRAFQSQYQLTDHKLAKQVGMSYATVRAVLRGEYKANPDPILRSIANKVTENIERADTPTDGEFVMSTLAREVITVAKMCVQSSRMGAVTAPAGSGKSMALKALPRIPDFDRAIYIEVEGSWTLTSLGRAIARGLGVSTSSQSAAILFERVTDALHDSNRLLIVDEAQYLDRGMLLAVRQLHDKSRIPILLAGTRDLRPRIQGDGVDTTLVSRLAIVRDLTARCLHGSGDPLHSLDDVVKIFEGMKLTFHGSPVKLDPGAASWMQGVANLAIIAPDLGDLRKACNVAKYAYITFRSRKAFTGTITSDMLQKVCALQIGTNRAKALADHITLRRAAG